MVDTQAAEWLESLSSNVNVVDAFRYFYPKSKTFSTFPSPEKDAPALGVRSSTVLATIPFLEECVQDCSYVRTLPAFLLKENAAAMKRDAKKRAHEERERKARRAPGKEGSDEPPGADRKPAKLKPFAPQHRPLILHYSERQEVPPEEILMQGM